MAIVESSNSTGKINHQALVNGDYKFCFGVPLTTIWRTRKVYMQLIIHDGAHTDDTYADVDFVKTLFLLADGTPLKRDTELGDMRISVDNVEKSLKRIHAHLAKSHQTQLLFAAHSTHDYNLNLHNNWLVQAWSIFQIVLMVSVGVLQVVIVRSYFNTPAGMISA